MKKIKRCFTFVLTLVMALNIMTIAFANEIVPSTEGGNFTSAEPRAFQQLTEVTSGTQVAYNGSFKADFAGYISFSVQNTNAKGGTATIYGPSGVFAHIDFWANSSTTSYTFRNNGQPMWLPSGNYSFVVTFPDNPSTKGNGFFFTISTTSIYN